jgi:putative transposase
MWPHAPRHQLSAGGTFIVTAATYGRLPVFRGRERVLHDALLAVSDETGWRLEAWAVFTNHYSREARPRRPGRSVSLVLCRLVRGQCDARRWFAASPAALARRGDPAVLAHRTPLRVARFFS